MERVKVKAKSFPLTRPARFLQPYTSGLHNGAATKPGLVGQGVLGHVLLGQAELEKGDMAQGQA